MLKHTKKLIIARNHIDSIDKKLFNLIKKRTNIIKRMLKLKKNKNQIVDTKRINEILRNIKKKSIKNNIDPNITLQIWRSIISAYVKYQKKKFRKK